MELRFLILLLCCHLWSGSAAAEAILWPTPHPGFNNGEPWESWAQPTASGVAASALFGCVRNGGNRFHEGIDIAPWQPRQRGEATDPIYAYLEGKVVHINTVAGNSSYGRYLILLHDTVTPVHYSLYSHLLKIDPAMEIGKRVKLGDTIGIMGRSAGGYSIPRDRAHLHFEIGFHLSDDFQKWYDRQGYGSRNHHRQFNGINLVGIDPLDYFTKHKKGQVQGFADYLQQLPIGFILRVRTAHIPDLIRRNPSIAIGHLPQSPVHGWEVRFTAFGFPLQFIPLSRADAEALGPVGAIVITAVDPEQLAAYACRRLIQFDKGQAKIGNGANRILQLLFNFK